MRLLLRANSHRPLAPVDAGGGGGGGFEIAASPDTPSRPDRWSWHIRILEARHSDRGAGPDATVQYVAPTRNAVRSSRLVEELIELGPDAAYRVLEVGYDPVAVKPEVQLLDTASGLNVARDEHDLTVVLVTAGDVRIENRHDLAAGDVLVLAGDDPLSIDLRAVADTDANPGLAVVTLRAPNNAGVPWVP